MTKKIKLFIVEGRSEENALGPILNKLISNSTVKFKVIEGDITGDYSITTVGNIEKQLAKRVRQFLGHTFFVKDLVEIIHLVDTDGSFISSDKILEKLSGDNEYTPCSILTTHKQKIERKNMLKTSVLNHLVTINSLTIKNVSIPYSIYFMSCNLDHVLYNLPNLSRKSKIRKATDFSDRFFGKETEFINFMLSPMIAIMGDYFQTWNKIQVGCMSLSRCSNFHLYFQKTTF